MILKIVLGIVALYLLIGGAVAYIAISYMMQSNDSDILDKRAAWLKYSRWQKLKGVCIGLVIWLPVAFGAKRKMFFK